MKSHYIYILEKDFIELDNLKNKYKVSLSTIVSTIFNHYCAYGQQQTLENAYLNTEKSKKVHIKPRLLYETNKGDMALTNAVHIYLNKTELAYMKLTLEQIKTIRSHISKTFNETREEFWNYNHDIRVYNRLQERFKKKNERTNNLIQ